MWILWPWASQLASLYHYVFICKMWVMMLREVELLAPFFFPSFCILDFYLVTAITPIAGKSVLLVWVYLVISLGNGIWRRGSYSMITLKSSQDSPSFLHFCYFQKNFIDPSACAPLKQRNAIVLIPCFLFVWFFLGHWVSIRVTATEM